MNNQVTITISGPTGSGKSAIAGEIEILCKALGLPVEWDSGGSEKNLTGADWVGTLDMYKPIIRIVESASRDEAPATPPAVVPAAPSDAVHTCDELSECAACDRSAGNWMLISPDGRRWSGATKLQCMSAETKDRVPATVQLERIFAAAYAERDDIASALMDAVEQYQFECQGGPLENCTHWQELRNHVNGEQVSAQALDPTGHSSRVRAALSQTMQPQAAPEDVPVELWRGERKVTIYRDTVLRSWGTNIDTEMSDAARTLASVCAAVDWLYEPAAGEQAGAVAWPLDEAMHSISTVLDHLLGKERHHWQHDWEGDSMERAVHAVEISQVRGDLLRLIKEHLAAPSAAIAAREQSPDDELLVACITLNGATLTVEPHQMAEMFGTDEEQHAYGLTFKRMTRAAYEALGEFDGF